MGTQGNCRLCGAECDLQASHIIPAFVFRWLKDTSATGFIRFGETPNMRVQDGPTRPWLCAACESRLSSWETRFASEVFHPLNEDGGRRLKYREWLLKFCVSISWRSLLMFMEDKQLGHFSSRQLAASDLALATWSDFLLDKVPHPGRFEQHLLPLDAVESTTTRHTPTNINRHFLRAIELGRRLIKPQPQPDGGDFCESQKGGGLSVVSGGDVAELLELVDASLDEIALSVFAP